MADPFTTAEVRRLAEANKPGEGFKSCKCDQCEGSRALLAFAARLEQDEQPHVSMSVPEFEQMMISVAENLKPSLDAKLEQAREEGRREILREIAKLEEHPTSADCAFCGVSFISPQPHAPDCLWLRAQSAGHALGA